MTSGYSLPQAPISASQDPVSSVASSSTRQKVFSYLKGKRDEYLTNGSGARESSSSIDKPAVAVEPSKNECLVAYPSYCRQYEQGYELYVHGWLFLPGLPNRKGRIISSLARQIAGLNSSPSSTPLSTPSEPADIELNPSLDYEARLASAAATAQTLPRAASMPATSDTDSLYSLPRRSSTKGSFTTEDSLLQQRLAPFMVRPVSNRKINIQIGLEEDMIDLSGENQLTDPKVTFSECYTSNSGRFSAKILLKEKPSLVSLQASDFITEVQNIHQIEPHGISVISDIDDTIKHTGITGDKREMFRNVFSREYHEIEIHGVSDWYQNLAKKGVKFHYVSNSPWQLYSTISEFMASSNFPEGSMHLKQYNGLLNGIFEPAAERKRMVLHELLKSFPLRKFILIGDSGEGDLEAYMDIAKCYPKQVLAIYIRDVTLPVDDKTVLDNRDHYQTQTNYIPRPDEIDNYDPDQRRSKFPSKRFNRSTPSLDRPPPLPTRAPATNQPNLIDLDDSSEGLSAGKAPPLPPRHKKPPPIPPKPQALRPETMVIPSPKDPRDPHSYPPPPKLPERHTPNSVPDSQYVLSSSQNDYGSYEILDKRIENWKSRMMRARYDLPPGIRLRMWRNPQDVEQESAQVIENEMHAQANSPTIGHRMKQEQAL